MKRFAGAVLTMLLLLAAGTTFGAEPAGGGKSIGLMSMGEKVYSGKAGNWTALVKLIDMRAHMKRLATTGAKADDLPLLTHHLVMTVTDPKSGKPIEEGTGTLSVTGPDRKSSKGELAFKGGQFGSDIIMISPGKYVYKIEIVSGGKKAVFSFAYRMKKS